MLATEGPNASSELPGISTEDEKREFIYIHSHVCWLDAFCPELI